ncbi:MAG: MgtC/SapB family protein [Lachnospiraceae bacterium]|nr:MgtC/SapB family protein [Lachnospiraceae bacterium]
MELLREINLISICVRVVLTLLIGAVLGIERERKNRPAGFRTHMLVCLGAALVMMTNQYVYQTFQTSDPVRMGAQVVSGIGFLGAGTIIITGKHQIKGITTAAGLWAAACCGLAIGIGFYEGAVIGGLFIFWVMSTLNRLEEKIKKKAEVLDLYVEFTGKKPFSNFLIFSRANGLDVMDLQINKNKYAKDMVMSVVMTVKSQKKRDKNEVLELIEGFEGILYIEAM